MTNFFAGKHFIGFLSIVKVFSEDFTIFFIMVPSALQVTFKSLESIEIHQTHYCKSGKYPPQVETGRQRPNSTVMPHTRPSPAERREEFSHIFKV
jgi:hypothetical protein